MIAVADAFTGQYASETHFMAALVDALKIEMKRRGWGGAMVTDVRWRAADRPGAAPAALIVIGPGHAPLGVDQVREKFRELRRKEAQEAEQGELV